MDSIIRRTSYDRHWPALYTLDDSGVIAITAASTKRHLSHIRELRQRVYVESEGRLGSAEDTAQTFDRFDDVAQYFVAYSDERPVGCIKVMVDSAKGLPCELCADLAALRELGKVVEFGHILVLPGVRSKRLGSALMREAFIFAIREAGAQAIAGDFFADPNTEDGLRPFYRSLGFWALGKPYSDVRFKSAPASVVGGLSIERSMRAWKESSGVQKSLLDFFFEDHAEYSRKPTAAAVDVFAIAQRKAEHNHPAYSKMALLLGCGVQMRGWDSFVETHDGKQLLALFDQYGNQSLGYSHPEVVARLQEKLASGNVNSSKVLYETEQIELAQQLSEASGGELQYAYFANGGGETIDNALKLARAATGRTGIIAAEGCFHGKTWGALSAARRADHVELFKPLLEGFSVVPFNDSAALEKAISRDTAAVLLEPVQAENGVIPPAPGYLERVRRLCDAFGAVLIFDEMQTAFGRTGELFAFQKYGVTPDIMCLGKAFGGGITPISAVVAKPNVWQLLANNPTTFGSSLGGNPLSCRAGLAVLGITQQPAFLKEVRHKGEKLGALLTELPLEFPTLVRAVRGVGMMFGVEFFDQAMVGLTLALLYRSGIISTYSLYNNLVLRVQPPMTIAGEDLIEAIDRLREVLREVAEFAQTAPTASHASEVSHQLGVHSSADTVLSILKRFPAALDPFCASNWGQRPALEDDFEAVLGTERLHWRNELEWTDDGLTSRATPGWLWNTLERRVIVRPLEPNRASVRVTVRWDAGTCAYEPFLRMHIAYCCVRRLRAISGEFAARCAGPDTLNGPMHPAGVKEGMYEHGA